MELEHGQKLRFGGNTVEITHPDKVLFPTDGITKGVLIEYYRRVAPWMLPYLHGRPLAMERFPGGLGARGFFQQKASDYFPAWIKTATVPKEGGTVTHVICDNAATLVYLANQGMVTPHAWLSRVDKLDNPDQMVFDLDPSGAEFTAVKAAARCAKRLLDELDLPAFVKTTGSRGLHVAVPLNRKADFDTVRAFARALAEVLIARAPDEWTLEQRKDKRNSRVFIDTNRNAYAQTVAPAYAVRSRPGAPVSVPIGWDELEHTGLRPDRWTIRNVFEKDRVVRRSVEGLLQTRLFSRAGARKTGGHACRWRNTEGNESSTKHRSRRVRQRPRRAAPSSFKSTRPRTCTTISAWKSTAC